MTDNHLFQIAKVISELSPKPTPTLPPLDHEHGQRTLPLRKNACAICTVCFTCSKMYSVDCTCVELRPRRGKKLPQGGLDSRAKKLNRADKEDYDFTIQWLEKTAHTIYRDPASNQIVGLANQTEVGLCKTHSSTLYRAKKRLERKNHSLPSSSSRLVIDTAMAATTTTSRYHWANSKAAKSPTTGIKKLGIGGGLAAKVKELCQQKQQPAISMDLDMMPSTSYKRKRMDVDAEIALPLSAEPIKSPQSSASTPLSVSSQHDHPSHSPSISSPPLPYLSPHLPPLQQQQQQLPLSSITTSLNSLSSSLRQQLHLSSSTPSKYYLHHHHRTSPPPPPPPSSSSSYNLRSYQLHRTASSSSSSPHQQRGSATQPPLMPSIQIETVSLKSMPSHEPCIYFIRNLAITDTFTFRHLLDETEMIGGAPPPPSGKRIIIADSSNKRIFPLTQAIRSVLPHPPSSHMEFCLGLVDKTSIDWSTYT